MKNSKNTIFPLIIVLSLTLFISSCEKLTEFFNPFLGTWKTGIFTLEFEDEINFVLKTGLGFTIESEGTYDYDKDRLFLNFSEDTKAEFSYEFNEDKTVLSILPKSKSDLFKTKITFEKQKE